MKKKLLFYFIAFLPYNAMAREVTVASPNGSIVVTVNDDGGRASYAVSLNGQAVIMPSALGFKADFGDFTEGLSIVDTKAERIDKRYEMRQAKQSKIHFEATQLDINIKNAKQQKMTIQFMVADNDVAFRYVIPRQVKAPFAMMKPEEAMNPKCAVIEYEISSFSLPDGTKTFLCPQITPMKGWERTKPSYEEEYTADAEMNVKSKYGQGYTFPCLFNLPQTPSQGGEAWVLISETGVTSSYVGSHLSDYHPSLGEGTAVGCYTIAFPQQGENNGVGSATAAIGLPGETPWRTITIGSSLKPIVETTIPFDLVEPLYEPTEDYKAGRYTWSWLIWQDESINWDDQIQFIDLAAEMGYEYCLVDGCWDTEIGRDRMPELSKYAQSKGVSLMLWYNSNGAWNDAPQTPRNCMSTAIARDREMAWLKSIGVKGIKVDFFAGDKQETMRLYEDILYDANRYGIQCIFHGCTLPRGWERMYPNYISSEAVLASENVYFSDYHAAQEPFQLTMHPFCRNAVGSMDWGGVIMNKYMSRTNKKRHQRQTTDAFELATAFTNQTAIQCIAIQPNNLQELPAEELAFLKRIPTTWDETRLLDGYPGKYVVLARRKGIRWYVAALNAQKEPLTLTLNLSMLEKAGSYTVLNDRIDKKGTIDGIELKPLKLNKKGMVKITVQPNGGCVVY